MQQQLPNDSGFHQKHQSLGINGIRTSGHEVRVENVTAVSAVANIIKSSLGPNGLDKMLVDELGELTQTNDGATILQRMEVDHPAGQVLVDLARLQDEEIGDGTTSVVILAAELLRNAQKLIRKNVHPSNIIIGYKVALREAIKGIKAYAMRKVSPESVDLLNQIARTSLSSKVVSQLNEPLFSSLVVKSVLAVQRINEIDGSFIYPRKSIGILKQIGKGIDASSFVSGCVLQTSRTSQDMPMSVSPARLALIDFDLRAVKLRLGMTASLSDPSEVRAMQEREMDITRDRVRKIIGAGANVLLTTNGMDDAIQKLLVDAGVIGARRIAKDEMFRIARATGAKIQTTLCDLNGEEFFNEDALGSAETVEERRIGEDSCLVLEGCTGGAVTMVLRGGSSVLLDECERALNDAIHSVSCALEASEIVAGGGAVETLLSTHLESVACSMCTRDQPAVLAFAQSLLAVPKQLAINSGCEASMLVSKLRAAYVENLRSTMGLDLNSENIFDAMEHGIVEPGNSKVKSIRFATEAAVTILRIDDFIKLNAPAEREDPSCMR